MFLHNKKAPPLSIYLFQESWTPIPNLQVQNLQKGRKKKFIKLLKKKKKFTTLNIHFQGVLCANYKGLKLEIKKKKELHYTQLPFTGVLGANSKSSKPKSKKKKEKER